jgi:DNA-binding NarL/FixJ family response regulator
MPLRVLIVDDSQRFLDAARTTLNRQGLTVVGTATSPAAALGDTEMLRPDAVLVDIGLGEASGFELARQLVHGFPNLRSRVVLISARAEEDFADLITESPAVGFIPKSRLSARSVRELLSRRSRRTTSRSG